MLEEYRVHEEHKALGPNAQPCGKQARGLHGRLRVVAEGPAIHFGKESNRLGLEERMREQVEGEADYLNRCEECQLRM